MHLDEINAVQVQQAMNVRPLPQLYPELVLKSILTYRTVPPRYFGDVLLVVQTPAY